VVETRPGAGTVIGTTAAAKSDPDGYTLLMNVSNLATNQTLVPNLPYDTMRDFDTINRVKARGGSISAPGPVVALNEIVALAMVDGPRAALARLDEAEPALAGYHRVHAVRAHLLEEAGDRAAARACYRRAAELTLSLPERRYLLDRAARC